MGFVGTIPHSMGLKKPRVSILGNYTPKIVHPLEENLYDFRQEVCERASPKLKKF